MADSARVDDLLTTGHTALARGQWTQARSAFAEVLARRDVPEAHEGLSWAAWWLEDVAACLEAREHAYQSYRQAGDLRGAARMALWLGDDHIEFHGAEAVAGGWFRRATGLLESLEPCPEHGWLAVFEAHAALNRQDLDTAAALAREAREIGRRQGAVDLEMFALATEGVVLLHNGEVASGLGRLDEAVAAALAGEYANLAPAAWSCCLLMSSCEQLRDYERASQWCARIEEFSRRMDARFVIGVCRAHYGVVLFRQGGWERSERELVEALGDLTAKRPQWRAEALVRLGDLRRRQGRLTEAAELFEQAPQHPLAQVGMAALSLEQGDAPAARDLLERALRQSPPGGHAGRVDALELLVQAEVALGADTSVRAHLDELRAIAEAVGTTPMGAAVRLCEGQLASAAGNARQACDHFEDAVDAFLRAGAPLEAASARVELAASLLDLGRTAAAERELRAALKVLDELGAAGSGTRARTLLNRLGQRPHAPGGEVLTPRQVEVLKLIAEGRSDQEIAARLVLSEHTVHRHVANIYRRLDCSSRAAAVAHAGRLGLL